MLSQDMFCEDFLNEHVVKVMIRRIMTERYNKGYYIRRTHRRRPKWSDLYPDKDVRRLAKEADEKFDLTYEAEDDIPLPKIQKYPYRYNVLYEAKNIPLKGRYTFSYVDAFNRWQHPHIFNGDYNISCRSSWVLDTPNNCFFHDIVKDIPEWKASPIAYEIRLDDSLPVEIRTLESIHDYNGKLHRNRR